MEFKATVSYLWSGEAKRQSLSQAELLQEKSHLQLADAQEKTTTSRDLEIEVQNQAILSDDMLFKIFILLPTEVIVRLQFVCKQWFRLINSSLFVRFHAQQSETVLVCQRVSYSKSDYCGYLKPIRPQGIGDDRRCCFHLLNFNHGDSKLMESSMVGLVNIRASYDGLILSSISMGKSLILMNPITRKHITLPSATDDRFSVGSFGIAFDNEAKTYKVVHLFIEESGYNGAEILSVHSQKWTRIDGPELLIDTTESPASVGGSLHWLCWKRGCHYFISINVQDEKFISKKLPACRADMDRLLEIGGNLGFVTHAKNELQVWISTLDSGSSENWIKQYSISPKARITYCNPIFSIPICSSSNGRDLVLQTKDRRIFVTNFDNGKTKQLYSRQRRMSPMLSKNRMDQPYIPHRHTLVAFGRSS